GGSLDARLAVERGGDGGFELGYVHTGLLQDGCGDAAFLLEEREEDVRAFQLRVGGFRGETLGGLKGLLKFLGDFIEWHDCDFGGILATVSDGCNAPLADVRAWI